MSALAPLLALAVAAPLCGCMTNSTQGQYVGLAPTNIAVVSSRSVHGAESPQPPSALTPGQMPEFTEKLDRPDPGKIAAVRGGDIMVMTDEDKADQKRHLADLKKMLAAGAPGVQGVH